MQKNIILDFDGTLIDTERVMMRSVMEYAEMNGVPNDEEFMLKFVGVSPQKRFSRSWASNASRSVLACSSRTMRTVRISMRSGS